MFEKEKTKGQTSVEMLIVIGGVLIIAIVVVMIFISTGSAKADDITKTDTAHEKLLDKTVFPPTLDSIKLTDSSDTNVTIKANIIESASPNVKDYCLVVNDEVTDYCQVPDSNGSMTFNIPKATTNYYAIALVSRSNADTISSNSFVLTESIATIGTGSDTGDTGDTGDTDDSFNFTCPSGYIKVPGNADFGTMNGTKGGFCVMKWEAKYDQNGDGIGDANKDCAFFATTYNYGFWEQGKPGCNILDPQHKVVSTGEGYPIGKNTLSNAIDYCSVIGVGTPEEGKYHLITNNEWMTIARNIESVGADWNSGTAGVGVLKRGVSRGTVALVDYSIYCPYNLSPDTNYYGIDYVGNPCSSSKRGTTSPAKLVINNGEIDDYNRSIWDLSGNLYEWVSNAPPVDTFPVSMEPYTDQVNLGDGNYFEFTNISNTSSFPVNQYGPNNNFLTATAGIGQISSWHTDTGSAEHGMIRGNAGLTNPAPPNSVPAGIYAITFLRIDGMTMLSNSHATLNYYIGFRCTYTP